MVNKQLVEVYATALLDLANDEATVQKFLADSLILKDILDQYPMLEHIWSSHLVDDKDKHEMVADLLGKAGVSQSVCNFCHVLIDRHHIQDFAEINEEFVKLATHKINAKDAYIYTTEPLTDDQLRRIVDYLQWSFNIRVFAHNVIDPSVIGGVRVVMEDETIDGSVAHQLEKLRAATVMGTK